MVAGIFLFDKYLSEGKEWLLGGMFLVFFVLGAWFAFYSRSWRKRWIFGFFVSGVFFLWGGLRVCQERTSIEYEWKQNPSVYQGIIQTVPEKKGKVFRAEVYVTDEYVGAGKLKRVNRTILLYWIPDSLQKSLSCGDYLCFHARITRPFFEEKLTKFNYADYLLRKGISGTALAYVGHWSRLNKEPSLTLLQRARLCQQRVVDIYRSWPLDEDVRSVVAALTIGDKRELTSDLKAVYSAAGASHVLALSGLHIGILSGLLWMFLYPLTYLKHGRKFLSICIILVLWAFAYVSGLSASVVRAVVMCSLYVLASFCSEERFAGIYSLVLSAFLMLVYNPFYLFDISFQLSFAAVSSILAFYPLCVRLLNVKNRLLRYFWSLLCVSFSAQLGTFPFVLVYFGAFPTYFLLANLVVAPLAVCVLALALMSLLFSFIPFVGGGFIQLLNIVTLGLNKCMWSVQQISGSQITSIYLSSFQAFLLVLILVCIYQCWIAGLRRKACYWYRLLFFCQCFVFACWIRQLRPAPTYLSFFRSEVYTSQGQHVTTHMSDTGLISIGKIYVGLLNNGYWGARTSSWRLPLDYAYICRGFKGSLIQLNELFKIRQVILDASLSDGYRESLIKECQLLKISYTDLSVCGSYSIAL